MLVLRKVWCSLSVIVALGLTASGRAVVQDARPSANRAWPPPVQRVSDESPALDPRAALETFFLPPGYRLELVASEPMIQDPIAVDIDVDGRLWVVEMRGFMPNAAGNNERAPVGRISVLDDDDDDGRMDRSTVFLDNLVLPRSVKALDRGVLVAEPPHLWLARDTNGDSKADAKEVVRDDFGRALGNPEHNANGLLWGLDNWIYTSEHDGHLRLRAGRWEHAATLLRGQWGVSMDDVGRVYRNWNEAPLFVDLFPARYLLRNPHLVRTRGVYEPLMEQKDMVVWPVRPTRGVNRGYREGLLRPDGTITTYVSAGTPVVYRGDRLPAELQGNVFVTEPAGNLVHRLIVTEDAAGRLHARNAYARGEFLASTDERFRPVNLLSAPDGTLYIVDMYRGVIQHGVYQSEYLKHHIQQRALEQPIGYGRIYRVVHESTRRDRKPALSRQPSAALVDVLGHPNGWWRDAAQRLIVERRDRTVAPALRELAANAPDERTRLHALWTLEGLEAVDVETVRHGLGDPSPYVRASAIRLAEPWLRESDHPLHASVVKVAGDEAAVVRRQAALSLGELPPNAREQALGGLLVRDGGDPIIVDAIVSGLKGQEAAVLGRLLSATASATPREDAVTMLAAAIMSSRDARAIEQLIELAAETDRRPWQRLAVLRGMEAVLPGRGAGVTGGFTGPGLAATSADVASGEGSGASSDPFRVTLERLPAGLMTLERSASRDVAALARRLAAALDWPGKPRPRGGDVKPLTPDEQKRFTAGQQVYQNLCAACHQADGRGQPALGPPLVGSKWVTGRAGLAARIILNGKEGAKMMPPLQMLSNDQVAAVLTYVRRSWGHTASAVDVNLVREVRGASTGRTRPWTEEELAKVSQPDGPPQRTR
jgi:mono/diheme cytochrome c family protein/glucose/arabinose dehydrogenase